MTTDPLLLTGPLAEANDRLRDALALHVAATVTAPGIPLPTDDPLSAG